MKAIVLLLAALSASCVPGPHVEADIGISVTETEGGVTVENTASVACIVVVESPEGEQRCDLPVGERVTVTGITEPVKVWAVGACHGRGLEDSFSEALLRLRDVLCSPELAPSCY